MTRLRSHTCVSFSSIFGKSKHHHFRSSVVVDYPIFKMRNSDWEGTKTATMIGCMIGCFTILGTMFIVVISSEDRPITTRRNVTDTPATDSADTSQQYLSEPGVQQKICGRELIPAVASACFVSQSRPTEPQTPAPDSEGSGLGVDYHDHSRSEAEVQEIKELLVRRYISSTGQEGTGEPESLPSTSIIQMVARFCCVRGCDHKDIKTLLRC